MAIAYSYELDLGAQTCTLGVKDTGVLIKEYEYDDSTKQITFSEQTSGLSMTLAELALWIEALTLWMGTLFSAFRPANTEFLATSGSVVMTATEIELEAIVGGATALDAVYTRATGVTAFATRPETVLYWSDLKVWFDLVQSFLRICTEDSTA